MMQFFGDFRGIHITPQLSLALKAHVCKTTQRGMARLPFLGLGMIAPQDSKRTNNRIAV
jgi:hypothetical protein